MPRHAALPFHLYVNVSNAALGDKMPEGVTRGIWHAAYCRPGQLMQAHVLLETGAHWSGLHLHDMSTTSSFLRHGNDLQPWGGMGDELEIVHLPYLEGLEVRGSTAGDKQLISSRGFCGRHTGLVFDWRDGFSRYPQEHKPLNLIELFDGQFMLYPNNFCRFLDKHFTSWAKSDDLAKYRRNDLVIWEA